MCALQAHLAYPPRPTFWYIQQAVSPSLVSWFRITCTSLEELYVNTRSTARDLLPHLLLYAASACPRLRILNLEYGGLIHSFSACLLSLGMMSQLKELRLCAWRFPQADNLGDIQQLSGLSSLEASTFLICLICPGAEFGSSFHSPATTTGSECFCHGAEG